MALFTIDRTINFNEQKVKGLIKIIKESNNVEQIEDKMIENGIVSLMEGTDRHGFFRRRWVTFLSFLFIKLTIYSFLKVLILIPSL